MELVPAYDFETVKSRYIDVINHTPEIEQYARWIYGKHPTDERLRLYIENGEMYLLIHQEGIAGMVAVVMCQGQEYEAVSWAEKFENHEVATLHLLAVCPEYQGRSLGSMILDLSGELAKRCGKKALRLDVLESNLPAQRMYEKAGFVYRGKQHWYAENTGWTDFLFYEKALSGPVGRKR
ncbi:MAG: GNAT family N-acetyltransferase [Clostridiales bacterium]|nr:GNAT family N-acetyltransferase [Clostridiales bacterium]